MEIGLAIGFIILSILLLKKAPSKRLAICLSVVYAAAIIYLAFISREPAPYLRYSVNPFGAARRGLEFGGGLISGLFHGDVRVTNWTSLEGIILNVLLFVPLGYLFPILFPHLRWWQMILFGLAFSLTIELLQLITRLGYADIDDLINNPLGAVIGFLCYKLFLEKHAPLR